MQLWAMLVTQRGDVGQHGTEDGLRERNVECSSIVRAEPADGAVANAEVDPLLMDPTQVLKVINGPDDPARRRLERRPDALSKRCGMDRVTLRICADLAISDQTAASQLTCRRGRVSDDPGSAYSPRRSGAEPGSSRLGSTTRTDRTHAATGRAASLDVTRNQHRGRRLLLQSLVRRHILSA